MSLTLRRITLFTKDMPRMIAFYGDVLGLPLVTDDPGYKEFDAGGCKVALHNGTSRIGARPPKIGFWSADVSKTRNLLISRGAKMGKMLATGRLIRCEGKDPDGNTFAISNRV